jgi:hypothetical protein
VFPFTHLFLIVGESEIKSILTIIATTGYGYFLFFTIQYPAETLLYTMFPISKLGPKAFRSISAAGEPRTQLIFPVESPAVFDLVQ